MNFPDLNHFLQLRKDLWHWPSSRAALMVGAGLSLNAEPAPGTHTRFPTWRQLARAMFDEVYPPSNDPTKFQEHEERFNRTGPLRIASEFDAAFGPAKLASFIRGQIPDIDHQPGSIHKRLLQLPWRDVFTTNYDMLLEKTEVPGRAYQPVTTAHDLTTAFSPRIIKLHGSLPLKTPFIITEEDYRTYPTRFAPFVNTVRQSLIENSLVLLGFSGDDPNFLEWTGWIRDELDDSHAPIYLVGYLSLDAVQRSLLTKRGVTPIDFAPALPCKKTLRGTHESAILWLLDSLMAARPVPPERWPESKITSPEMTEHTPPVHADGPPEPVPVDIPLILAREPDKRTIKTVIERWRFERTQYPGWIVATERIWNSLWINTEPLIPTLITCTLSMSIDDRVDLYRELNWRLEMSMIPLTNDIVLPLVSTLDELFTSLTAATSRSTPPRSESVETWFAIAFSLLRHARENYDTNRWNTLKISIDKFVTTYPQFADQTNYEYALWLMWNIDRNKAKDVLKRWHPSSNRFLFVMRKAGMLAELDDLPEARALLRSALSELRRGIHLTTDQSIDLLSLEGWCMYLIAHVELAICPPNWSTTYDEFFDRWQELKTWDCNPWSLTEYFDNVLSAAPPTPARRQEVVQSFDPWNRIITRRHMDESITPWVPAFAYVRLHEKIGIPMVLRNVDTPRTLCSACRWMTSHTVFWSPSLLVRAGKTRDLEENHFLTRVQISTMQIDLVKRLNTWAIDALSRETSSLGDSICMNSPQASVLEALIEVSSRLVVRLEHAELDQSLNLALHIHRQPAICSHVRLNRKCLPWFRRIFDTASDTELLSWIPDLIRYPLSAGCCGRISHDLQAWPDPMTGVPTHRLTAAATSSADLEAFHKSIDDLLTRASTVSEDRRHRSMRRLVYVFFTGLMTQEQRKITGELLWKNVGTGGFPDLPGFPYFNYLHLPAPTEIDVITTVKGHTLSRNPVQAFVGGITRMTSVPDPIIQGLSVVSKPIVDIEGEAKRYIEWSLSETQSLWKKIVLWWENDKNALSTAESDGGYSTIAQNTRNAGEFLVRAVLPAMGSADEQEWEIIMNFLTETRSRDVYLTTVLPYVLLHRPTERDFIVRTILDDVASCNEYAVAEGVAAIRHWIHLATGSRVEYPPRQALGALKDRVVFRRREGSLACLGQLARLVVEKPRIFDDDDIELFVSSLPAWREALLLPVPDGSSGDFSEEERPELRAALGGLASVLHMWGKERFPDRTEPAAIASLRESYSSDPLPEVRRSFGVWNTYWSRRNGMGG